MRGWSDEGASELGIDGLVDASAIGEGGNAIVYRAYQPSLDRQVAVKVLKGLVDDDARRRFDRERKAMGRLSEHDGIVTVYESGFTGRGEPYLVMPLLPGSLDDELRAGPLPWTDAVATMIEVCDTVGLAHESGVVHRDLKPGNIMRSRTGRALVADFGIARLMDASSSFKSTALTLTPAYSPPEALEATLASARADVYSLGATLFALIAGHAPFVDPVGESSLLVLMRRILDDPIPDLRPVIPDALQTVLERSMAKDPAERYDDAAQFARALRAVTAHTQPSMPTVATGPPRATVVAPPIAAPPMPDGARTYDATPPPAVTPSASAPRSRKMLLVGVAACSMAAVLALALTLGRSGGDEADSRATDDTAASPSDVTTTPATDAAVTDAAVTGAVARTGDNVEEPDPEPDPESGSTTESTDVPDSTVSPEAVEAPTAATTVGVGPSDFEPYATSVLAAGVDLWTVVPQAGDTIVLVDPIELDAARTANLGFFAPTVAVAVDWVAGAGVDGQLGALDLATGDLERIDLDRRVRHLAADGDVLWVVTAEDDGSAAMLHRFDRRTLSEDAVTEVGDFVLHLDASEGRVWTAAGSTIKAFDAATLELVIDTTTGVSPIDDIDAFGRTLWVSGGMFASELADEELARGVVVRIDADTGAASPVQRLTDGLSIFEQASVAATGGGAWVTIETTNEAFFVTDEGTLGAVLELPDEVQDAQVIGDALWVLAGGSSSGQLWGIDLPTG